MLTMQHLRLKSFPDLKRLKKYYKKTTYFLRFCFLSLYVSFIRMLVFVYDRKLQRLEDNFDME